MLHAVGKLFDAYVTHLGGELKKDARQNDLGPVKLAWEMIEKINGIRME